MRKKEAGHVETSISFHLSRFGASLSSELTNRDGLIDPGVSNSPVVSTRTKKEEGSEERGSEGVAREEKEEDKRERLTRFRSRSVEEVEEHRHRDQQR